MDFILILFFTWFWTLFVVIWAEKLYKIYFGVIIWFLIFLVLNAQIENLENLSEIYYNDLTSFQSFLVENKEIVLWTITCFIPIFWVFTALNDSIALKQKPRISTTILTWAFLPVVLLWIMAYIKSNAYVKLEFVSDILSVFDGSYIYNLLEENNFLVFIFIIALIFYKVFVSLFVYMFGRFYNEVIEKMKMKYGNKEES